MATGMAIMGFGGAALIASPLSVWLMTKFSTPTHLGVSETFICLGLIYLIFMWVGTAIVRVPPPGWKPQGYRPLLAVRSSLPIMTFTSTTQSRARNSG